MIESQKQELTDEQVEKWRNMLYVMVGPYAKMMTKEEIQTYRDNMQNKIDNEE